MTDESPFNKTVNLYHLYLDCRFSGASLNPAGHTILTGLEFLDLHVRHLGTYDPQHLSRLMDITPQTIYLWQKKAFNPIYRRYTHLHWRIQKVLGVPPDRLIPPSLNPENFWLNPALSWTENEVASRDRQSIEDRLKFKKEYQEISFKPERGKDYNDYNMGCNCQDRPPEEWRPHPYLFNIWVSSYGRVKRRMTYPTPEYVKTYADTESFQNSMAFKFYSPILGRSGLRVTIYTIDYTIDDKQKRKVKTIPTTKINMYVKQLVAHTYLGPQPEGHRVAHKDGNKYHVCPANLEYRPTNTYLASREMEEPKNERRNR